MLPGIDGLSVLRNIRLEDERIPILILSARGDPDDRVKGFSYGVDDYLAKPFNLDEFLLRVKRLLTRGSWSQEKASTQNGPSSLPRIYQFGNNRIDFRDPESPWPFRRNQPDRTGNQAVKAFYRQPRPTPFQKKASGNRLGIRQGNHHTDGG
jgi:DNA-binding response OmpR family regulator